MDVTIKSYRKEREKEILDSLQKGLDKVGQIVERQSKLNVSKSPPEHPQRQTSELFNNIIYEVGDGYVDIGTNILHGKYLEHGTSRMPPYPWLYPALEVKRQEIIDILKSAGSKNVSFE